MYACDKCYPHVPHHPTSSPHEKLSPVGMTDVIPACQVPVYYSNVIYSLFHFLVHNWNEHLLGYSFCCSRSKCCKLLFVQFNLRSTRILVHIILNAHIPITNKFRGRSKGKKRDIALFQKMGKYGKKTTRRKWHEQALQRRGQRWEQNSFQS